MWSIRPILLIAVLATAMPGFLDYAVAQQKPLGSDITKSEIVIEVLDFESMCMSRTCLYEYPGSLRKFWYMYTGATVRFTNRSDNDPKDIRPCNLSIGWPKDSLEFETGKPDWDLRWMLEQSDGLVQEELNDEEQDQLRDVVVCADDRGITVPIEKGGSLTVTVCNTIGDFSTGPRETIKFFYSDNEDFGIKVRTDLIGYSETEGRYNKTYGGKCG